jgi:perosamine synthetase
MSTSDNNSPQRPWIPLAVPVIAGNEWAYVKECLDTNWISSVGPFVDRFEKLAAEVSGAQYAVATVNGTAALHVALLVTGVRPDDEVIVSDLTFIAAANAVRHANAWPVFVDVEPDYWQLDPQKLADFCRKECEWTSDGLRNRSTGRIVRAILPVHVLGHPVDMDSIVEIADRYGLFVVADAAEALGAGYKSRPIGAIAPVSCLSFNGNKVVTSGGGGMIVTDSERLARKARYLTTQAKDDPSEYIHCEVGYNYRLTNVLAALGCAQIERLEEHVAAKRHTAAFYRQALSEIDGISGMTEAPWAQSSFWLYTILVDPEKCREDCRSLMRHMKAARIECRPLWQPMHLSPAHAGSYSYRTDVSERLYHQALSLPSSVAITPDELKTVSDEIRAFVSR